MKKHNAFKVVLITLLVFLLLTWILPAASYSSGYVDQGRTQMGLFDIFNYPLTSLSYFGYIAIFFVLVGGFYGILFKIPAYRTFLDKIVSAFSGKEKLFVSLIMIIFAAIVSVCGIQYEIFLFVPLVVSIILLMGYDKIVAAMTVIGSISVGLAGTTYAYSNVSILLSSLSLNLDYEIGVRLVILLVGLVLLIFNTIRLMNKKNDIIVSNVETISAPVEEEVVEDEKIEEKVEKTTKSTKSTKSTKLTKSSKTSTNKNSIGKKNSTTKKSSKSTSKKKDLKAANKDEDVIVVKNEENNNNNSLVPKKVNERHMIWPIVTFMLLLFILLILAFIPWSDNGFGISLFDDVTSSVTEAKIFGFALFGKLLGTTNAFGAWTVADLALGIFFVVLILAIIYKVKFDDILDGFIEGAKKALAPAVIVLMVYTGLVMVTYHPFQLCIYKFLFGFSHKFNVLVSAIIMPIVAILSSIFNADPSYVYNSVLPYLASIYTNSDNYSIVGIIFQSIYGLTTFVGPTSIVLLATLSVLKINYLEWFKKVWKFLLEFLVILIIIFIILTLI